MKYADEKWCSDVERERYKFKISENRSRETVLQFRGARESSIKSGRAENRWKLGINDAYWIIRTALKLAGISTEGATKRPQDFAPQRRNFFSSI